jgi:PAS domain S-box-containing protein
MPETLPPNLKEHLGSFNGSLDSLQTFFNVVNQNLQIKTKSLEECKNRFCKMLERAHDGIALLDKEWQITYVTARVLTDFGYTEEELFSGALSLGHPDDRPMLQNFLSELSKHSGRNAQIKYRVKTKAGEWRWVRSTVTNFLDEPGLESFVFNYEDITNELRQQKMTEFEMKNREALINSTADLMWSINREMCLVSANNAFLNRVESGTGVALKNGDSLLNSNIWQAEKLKKWRNRYKRALAGEAFSIDDYFDHNSIGKWEETRLNPIYEGNEIIGVSCFIVDITEKKAASEAIRKSEEMMAEAQSISHFGSWEYYFDETGKIRPQSIKWSDELYRILGYQPNEVKVSPEIYYSHIHQEDFSRVKETMQKTFETNSGYDYEYRIVRKNGETIWIRSKGKIRLHEGGRPMKIVGTAQDITERKIAEQERTRMMSDLVQRNKELEQFTYIVSHNLRAPVAQIQGLTSIFMGDDDLDTRLKCANGLSKASISLDEVIKDLNHILSVKKDITEVKTHVNIELLVNEVCEGLQECIKKQDGNIITNIPNGLKLFSLKGYLYSIFYNLISNALKYKKENEPSVISISSETNETHFILRFRDNGIGINLDIHGDKIFGLYKRFHEKVEGKGIGLYMVKTQVETLGGRISVESMPDWGTEFTIIFNR